MNLASRRHAAGHWEFTPVKHRRLANRTEHDRPAIPCGKRRQNLAGTLVQDRDDASAAPYIDQAAKEVPQHGTVGSLGPRAYRFVPQEIGKRTPGDWVGRLRPTFHDLTDNLEQDWGLLVEVAIGGTHALEFVVTMIAEKYK